MNRNRNIQHAQRLFRRAGLLPTVERVRFAWSVVRYAGRDRRFRAAHPDFMVPPKALAYDAYSAPDWDFYKTSGERTAAWLFRTASDILGTERVDHIYEWGCGPARVLRHVPAAFGPGTEVWGSDYNAESIWWCKANLPGINFFQNALTPPLAFAADYLQIIYSISVFTHLSETVGHQWADELYRVARPGGLLIISTNGDSMTPFLGGDEPAAYRQHGIVIRGQVEEGKKMFWACHSPDYVRTKLFHRFDIIRHEPAGFPQVGQDLWILRKRA